MAQKYLVRCKDASQTAGTGTLTLDNSTSANWQTPAQAVARGLLANGDEVRYTISDTSDPVVYEEGRGTIGSAGLTLTRDTVRQSSSGTSKISWPSGGARDVVISWSPGDTALVSNQGSDYTAADFATNLGLPRLSAVNTYTDTQIIQKDAAGTTLRAIDARNSGAASALNIVELVMRCKDDAGTQDIIYQQQARLTTTTPGAEVSLITFRGMSAGTVSTFAQFDGAFKDGSGNKFVAFPTGGSVALHFGSAPPTGFTRLNETQSRLIRLAKSGDTIGSTGGTDDLFDGGWATAGYTLQITEVPSHTHTLGGTGGVFGAAFSGGALASGAGAPDATFTATGSAGGGGSHAHNMATPFYKITCFATYD